MSVHMMTIEKKYKVTMRFYGLIPMGSDKTGSAQANLLVTRLKTDQIFDKVKKNIVGFVRELCYLHNVIINANLDVKTK